MLAAWIAFLGRLKLTEAQKCEDPNLIEEPKDNQWCLPLRALQRLLVEPFDAVLGASFSPLETILGRHGAILGPLGAILGRLGGMLGHVGGLDGPPGPFWSLWRAPGRLHGRPGTPGSRGGACGGTLVGGGWSLRRL